MAELELREKKIVHCMHILINKQLEKVPHEVRVAALQAQFLARGIEWNEQEITDLILAINQETKETIQNAYALLQKYAPTFKGLKSLE